MMYSGLKWEEWYASDTKLTTLEKRLGKNSIVVNNPVTAFNSCLTELTGNITQTILVSAGASPEVFSALDLANQFTMVVDIDPKTLQLDVDSLLSYLEENKYSILITSEPFGEEITPTLKKIYGACEEDLTFLHDKNYYPCYINSHFDNFGFSIKRLPFNYAVVNCRYKDTYKNVKWIKDEIYYDSTSSFVAEKLLEILDTFNQNTDRERSIVSTLFSYRELEGASGIRADSYLGYPVWVSNARKTQAHLKSHGIPSEVFTTFLDFMEEEDLEKNNVKDNYPGCLAVQNRILCLPVNAHSSAYADVIVDYVKEMEETDG